MKSGLFVSFNASTGESFTGYQLAEKQSIMHELEKLTQPNNFMKYDKTKHLDLLKYSQRLEKEGKHIYDESRKDFFELCEYSAMMIAHLHWENQTQYFELIEQFSNGPINFLDLRKKHRI